MDTLWIGPMSLHDGLFRPARPVVSTQSLALIETIKKAVFDAAALSLWDRHLTIPEGVRMHVQHLPKDCFIAQLLMIESTLLPHGVSLDRELRLAAEAVKEGILKPTGVGASNVSPAELQAFIKKNTRLAAKVEPRIMGPVDESLSPQQRKVVDLLGALTEGMVGMLFFLQPGGSPDWRIMLGVDIKRTPSRESVVEVTWHLQHSDGNPPYTLSTHDLLLSAYGSDHVLTPQLCLFTPQPPR